jgi:type III pantothenate kinase
VATNSRYTARRIRAVYGRSAQVCYLGVDANRFTPSVAPPATRVLSVGTLEPHKGFDFVIQALGTIRAAHRPSLTIVGRGGHSRMPAALRRLAARLQVDIELRQDVADHELVALYRSHALFVFGAHYEPFGLVVLEALASGLPVVAVNEGGVPEIVRHGETGYLVQRDAAQFGAAVERLLTADAERRAMARASRERALSDWSWDTATQRLELLLQQAAASHGDQKRGVAAGAAGSVL